MMIRGIVATQINAIADDEVWATLSSEAVGRDGHRLLPVGANLAAYRRNPIVLWGHSCDEPIARAEDVRIQDNKLVARIRFAASGISATADRIRGLVKNSI